VDAGESVSRQCLVSAQCLAKTKLADFFNILLMS
jgi:hypothetical protein